MDEYGINLDAEMIPHIVFPESVILPAPKLKIILLYQRNNQENIFRWMAIAESQENFF